MAKPSIGEAITASAEREKRKEVKELTVLERGSKESIYHLLFEKDDKDTEET